MRRLQGHGIRRSWRNINFRDVFLRCFFPIEPETRTRQVHSVEWIPLEQILRLSRHNGRARKPIIEARIVRETVSKGSSRLNFAHLARP